MKTVEMFFELIRYSIKGDELSKEAFNSFSSSNLLALLNLSTYHDVGQIISYALIKNNLISKEVAEYESFELARSFAVLRYENINYEHNQITKVFDEKSIDNIPLKGTVMRTLYPEPWMRTSCDIDILIHKEDKKKVLNLLVHELGYKIEHCFEYETLLKTPRKVYVEIHTNLTSKRHSVKATSVLSKVWHLSTVKKGYLHCMEMPDELYYFNHLSHMAKHFTISGCGVRPFIDLWLLNNAVNYNKVKREKLLKEGGLEKFENGIRKLANIWMNKEPLDQFSLTLQEFVLRSGVNGTVENLIASRQNKIGGKFRYFLGRIFLRYEELSRQYPTLKKYKFLTLFYQIKRWLRLISSWGMKLFIKSPKQNKNYSKDTIRKRRIMMKELGLFK